MLIVPKKDYLYYDLTSSPKVYIDLDGTLSDFFKYFAQMNYFDMRDKGISISEISPDHYRRKSSIRKYIHSRIKNKKVDYWAKVPKTKNGAILWNGLKQLKPYIFTGVIDGDSTMEMGKLKWCRRQNHLHFLNDDLHRLLINKNRIEYATNNGCPNILVDDDSVNCKAWEEAGGISYFFVDNPLVATRIVEEVREDVIRGSNIDFMLEWNKSLGRYIF